jgi:Conserved Oligomeric Golgi complex subunit 6, C-terminal
MSEKAHNINFNLDEDLGPPVFFLDAVADLRIILSAYDSSLAPIEHDEQEIRSILDVSLTPYLEHCDEASRSLPSLPQWIMLVNCYDLAKVVVVFQEELTPRLL